MRPPSVQRGKRKWCSGSPSAPVAVSASGYLLLFPFYVNEHHGHADRPGHHSVVAILFIASFSPHLYWYYRNGGRVSKLCGLARSISLGKEHHDLWLEEEFSKRDVVRHAPHLSTPAQ